MSRRYKGSVLSATPPTTTGGESGSASGSWTRSQQMQAQNASAWPAQPVIGIEDVFSTYIYTGNAYTQTISNGIDLAGKGGMVWIKRREASTNNVILDTARGMTFGGTSPYLSSNLTAVQTALGSQYINANADGFSFGINSGNGLTNFTAPYVSWTFRKQPKFFDVVTYTGDGLSGRTVAHSLGSVPGCIIVKNSGNTTRWLVYHKDLSTGHLVLNETSAPTSSWGTIYNVTSTNFAVDNGQTLNGSGQTYVAYVFAHNAGGFGTSGNDNVISCGSFTTDGSGNATVNLGYEPQFILYKRDGLSNWEIYDTMRGWDELGFVRMGVNTGGAESAYTTVPPGAPTATGFKFTNGFLFANNAYIYIAIRRPMKAPTSGTSVFSPITYVGANGSAKTITAGFPVDMDIIKIRNNDTRDPLSHNRRMGSLMIQVNAGVAEASYPDNVVTFNNAQNVIGLPVTGGGTNEINGASTSTYIAWAFRRASRFFDVVCYTGTGGIGSQSHNLGVAPELQICKSRNAAQGWGVVYNPASSLEGLWNSNAAMQSGGTYAATSTAFQPYWNTSGNTYVAYLFASCPGVSKVGSYTGNGSSQTINCGFADGARFVLIKRTDSTGDWYVWDTARGIVSASDPHLSLNSAIGDVTTDDSVDAASTGFIVNQDAATNVNVTSANYIYLAIA